MITISAFFLSFPANYSVLQPPDKYLQLTKREVSLKDTWMRVKERATEFRQDRLNTLKKSQLFQRIMMTQKNFITQDERERASRTTLGGNKLLVN